MATRPSLFFCFKCHDADFLVDFFASWQETMGNGTSRCHDADFPVDFFASWQETMGNGTSRCHDADFPVDFLASWQETVGNGTSRCHDADFPVDFLASWQGAGRVRSSSALHKRVSPERGVTELQNLGNRKMGAARYPCTKSG